jgi:hypothetical protein
LCAFCLAFNFSSAAAIIALFLQPLVCARVQCVHLSVNSSRSCAILEGTNNTISGPRGTQIDLIVLRPYQYCKPYGVKCLPKLTVSEQR